MYTVIFFFFQFQNNPSYPRDKKEKKKIIDEKCIKLNFSAQLTTNAFEHFTTSPKLHSYEIIFCFGAIFHLCFFDTPPSTTSTILRKDQEIC